MPYYLRAMKRSLRFLLFLVLFSACTSTAPQAPPAAAVAPAPAAPVHVVIVGTTDVHGWFDGHTETLKGSTRTIRYGGLDVLSSYVDALRTANPGRVVLVDSGDLFQGTLESNLFEGEPVIRAYNQIGYTASAVGNHEFDYGPEGSNSVVRAAGEDPLGALKKNAGMAKFPFLSANMVEKATGRTPAWAKPWVMTNAGGAKIAIVGLSTPDTPNTTVYSNVKDLDFTDPVAAAIRAAADARAAGADAVVVAAHMGGRCSDLQDVHDVASCDSRQEAMRFLAAMPPGTIDGYFGGHTHAQMREIINGVPAVQAAAYGVSFSTIDLWIDPASHRVVSDRSNLRPITMICSEVFAGTEVCDPRQSPGVVPIVPRVFEGKTMQPDVRVASIVRPYLDKVAQKKHEPLGIRATGAFTKMYEGESTIGDLLADSLRADTGADAALVNSGGIRAGLRAGDLTYGDMFDVSPFDNFVAVVTMTGAELREVLRIATTGQRGIMQVSGIRYTIDRNADASKPVAERDHVKTFTLANGNPVDPNALYRVVMPDFLTTGGDGLMPVMSKIPKERITIDQNQTLREGFIAGMRKSGGTVTPKLDGRITVIGGAPKDAD